MKKRAAAALVALLSFASAARAQPTAADRALATELFERGRALLAEGKIADACPKFEESQRLDPSPGTLLNLANCHEREGRTATAWTEFHEALAVAERERQSDRVSFAEEHIRALAGRLSHLVLVVPPELAAVELAITRDGSPLSRVAASEPIPVDPGVHRIEVRAAGYAPWSTSVDLGEAERRDVTIGPLEKLPEAPAPPVVAPVVVPAAPVPEPPAKKKPIAVFALAGVGVAGIVVGGVSGIVALDANARSDARCTPRCTDEGFDLNRSAKTAADISTVGFAVGAASLGASVVLYLATGSPSLRF